MLGYAASLGAETHVTAGSSVLRLPLLSWWGNLGLIFSRDFIVFTEGQYRPLSYAILAILRTWVSPENAVFWRVLFLLFQWLNGLLVYLVARSVFRSEGAAVAAGAVFVLHPLGTVVVGDPTYFHVLLGSTFMLGGAAAYVAERRWSLAAAVALYGAGLLASKVAVTLPLFLLGRDLVLRRRPARAGLLRLVWFALPLVVVVPIWISCKPHPRFFAYPALPAGTFWVSVLTTVGVSGKYWAALLVGAGLPAKLREVVKIIFSPFDWQFMIWAAVAASAFGLMVWGLRRRAAAALGPLLALVAFLPHANVVWNAVDEHVSLVHVYLPVAGLGLLIGSVVSSARAGWGRERAKAGLVVVAFMVAFYGLRLVKINWDSRTPEGYWRRSLRIVPSSASARGELGRILLGRGEDRDAFALLFGEDVDDIEPSCLVCCLAHLDRHEPLAALVHMRYVSEDPTGLKFERRDWGAARTSVSAGALDHAEMFLGRVLHGNPYDTDAMVLLARLWLLKGYARAAETMVGRALSIEPDSASAREVRALLAARLAAARHGAGPAIVKLPPLEWTEFLLAGERGPKFTGAVLDAAERLTGDPIFMVEAGMCLLVGGHYEEALWVLDKVLAGFSYEARPRAEVIQEVYSRLSDEGLVEACRRATEGDVTQALARRGLANALVSRGRADEAVVLLREAAELMPGCSRTRTELGTALLRAGIFDEAVKVLREVLEKKPDDIVVRHNLATALFRWGYIEEAVAEYRMAVESGSGDWSVKQDLAEALALSGRLTEAISVYRDAAAATPAKVGLRRGLGRLLARQGDVPGALGELTAALALGPADPDTMKELGRVHLGAGSYAEAVTWLERSLSVRGADPEAMEILSKALYYTGRVKESEAWLRKAAALRSAPGRSPVPGDE